MSEKTKDTQDISATIEELEKSWEDAKSSVLALLGEAPETDQVEKSQTEDASVEKSDSNDDGKMDYDEEDEDEDEEEDVSKSIEDMLEKSVDDDVAIAMDAEPFLRELVKSVDDRFVGTDNLIDTLSKSVKELYDLQKATAKMLASYGDLMKSTATTVEAIGNAPVPSGSVLRAGGERFEKAQTEELEMSKAEILEKSLKLARIGRMDGKMLTKIEGRLNKGMSLDADMVTALKQTVKEEV